MNQNQTVENDDLQKAIDDITNTTNTDPVFSDPVAAPSSVPEGDTGELGEPVGPFPEPISEPSPEQPDSNLLPTPESVPTPPTPDIPELDMSNFPTQPPTITSTNNLSTSEPTIQTSNTASNPNLNIHQIKEAALRDLAPLLNHLDMEPAQKFSIYRSIFEDLKDSSVLESAYKAASEIPDDTKRAEALLYLVESIDKM